MQILALAQQKYAAQIEQVKELVQNPDNKLHVLGTDTFALRWVVDHTLEQYAGACYAWGTNNSDYLCVTVFTEEHLAQVTKKVYESARQKMLDNLTMQVSMLNLQTDFELWRAMYDHVRVRLAKDYNMTIVPSGVTSSCWRISCAEYPQVQRVAISNDWQCGI